MTHNYHPITNALISIDATIPSANIASVLYALTPIPDTIASEPTYNLSGGFIGYANVLLFSLQQSGADVIVTFTATSNGQPSPLIVAGNLRSDVQNAISTYAPLPNGAHYIHDITNNQPRKVTWNVNGVNIINAQVFSGKNKKEIINAIASEMSTASGESWVGTPSQFDCSSMTWWQYGKLTIKNNVTGVTNDIYPFFDPPPSPPII